MENPSQSGYQPIDDKPSSDTEKLISNTPSTSTSTNPEVARKKSAPSYDEASALPTAQPTSQPYSNQNQPYQSYQNSAPPPSYQNLPNYSVSAPVENRPLTKFKFQDAGFTIFFLAWFIPANLLVIRTVWRVQLSAWWSGSTAPYWGFISSAFCGLFVSFIWISVILSRVFGTAMNERRATIVIFTISAISMSYVVELATYDGVGVWVYLLWAGCIIRILWDACITSTQDDYLSASIIQLLKPQIKAALVPISILAILNLFWLLFWGFNFSILFGSTYDFPAAHSFLFLVMIWSMMVMRSIVMSTTSAIISSWYINKGNINLSSYAMSSLMDSLIHCFGSVIFASIFVDAFGVSTWVLTRLHALLYGKKVKKSILTKISSKIEKVVNSSSFTLIVPERTEFVEASRKAHAYLKAASPAVRSTTMKYHNLFIGCQAFALSLGGSGNVYAATAGGMTAFAFTSVFHAACVALTTNYGRDPGYLQTVDNALAVHLQQKMGASEKDEV